MMITGKIGVTNYEKLEKRYAKFTGSLYCVAVSSGTAALHLSLVALGIGKGDEVIVPDFTMAACGFAVTYTGATPVFVDCGDDLNIAVDLIEAKITAKTKAIMPVHIYGRLCNMKRIKKIADKHGLKIIEDACEAQGAVFDSIADVTCYSFYANKIISAEEGGAITTDDEELKDTIKDLKNMSFGKRHDYFHNKIGFNYRMPESQAKLALKSLRRVGRELRRRRRVERDYDRMTPSKDKMPFRNVVWVYDTLSPLKGKDTRPFFKPLSSFPMYGGKCQSPKAEYYSRVGHYYKV